MKSTAAARTMILGCISFFALGIITAAIGPSLPDFSNHTRASLSQVGIFFTGLFLGALTSQAASGLLLDRFGARWMLTVGTLMLGTGVLAASLAASLPVFIAFSLFAGLGQGVVVVCLNVAVADAYPQKRAAAVNLVNVFFGIGAVVGPTVASLSLKLWQTALPAVWLGAGMQIILVAFFYFFLPAAAPRGQAVQPGKPASLFASPIIWFMAAITLIYVGLETGFGGWVSTYMQQSVHFNATRAALSASLFWLSITIGRMLGSYLGTRLPALRLLQISMLTAALGSLVLLMGSGRATLSLAGTLLLGVGFGPIFPTTLAIATEIYHTASGRVGSILAALGSLGGTLLPWLQGVLLEKFGPISAILLTVTGSLLLLAALALLLEQHRKMLALQKV